MTVLNAKGDRPTSRLYIGCDLLSYDNILHHYILALEYSHRSYIAALPVPTPVTVNLKHLLAGKPYLYQNSATREGRGLETLPASQRGQGAGG